MTTFDFDDFEKVTREDIEDARINKQMLGRNKHAGDWFNILVHGCGFGKVGHSNKTIANAIQENDPTVCNRPTASPDGRKESDTRTRGDTRIGNLAKGDASFIPKEAKGVYLAFENVFGPEWARATTPKELVLSRPADLFRKLIASSLPFNENLSPWTALQSIGLALTANLKIRPIGPVSLELSGTKGSANSELTPFDDLPSMRPREEFLLQLSGYDRGTHQLFVFEVARTPLHLDGENTPYCLFPHRLVTPDRARLQLADREGHPFSVFETGGQFTFIALAFPLAWDFADYFSVDPNDERWAEADANRFLGGLRAAIQEDPEALKFGRYDYRVG